VPSLDAAVYVGGAGGANLVLGEAAVIAQQARVGAGYFRVLGVAPAIGREFTREEDVPNGPAVAILSHALWQRIFGGRENVLSETILLRGEPYAIVGVMPASLEVPGDPDVWTPLRPSTRGEGAGDNYQIIARLKPGATRAQAEGELAATSTADLYRQRGYTDDTVATQMLEPLADALRDGPRQPIVLLGAGVGVVLLVACVNLAALLLARSGSRAKEIATRMALGCGRRAVVRQLLVEAGVLSAAGAALGLLIGSSGLRLLQLLGDGIYDEWSGVSPDARVLLVTLGLGALTSLAFGLFPAMQASRIDIRTAMAEGGSRSVAGGSRHWPRRLLVVAEVALGVVLLVGAGLLVRQFASLRSLDPGFETDGLVSTTASMLDRRYESIEKVNQLFDETLRRLRSTPGIEAAAVSLELPYDRLLNLGFALPDDPALTRTIANAMYVTPGFFEAFGIPIRQGRAIAEIDRADAPAVAVVNDAWVRFYSPDRTPIGRRIRILGIEREIAGVSGNVQQLQSFTIDGLGPGPIVAAPLVFVPATQAGEAGMRTVHTWFWPVWTVRAQTPSLGAEALRRTLREVDPLLPTAEATTMSQVMARATSSHRLLMSLMGLLAGAAVLLAAIGIHGIIAQSVAERRRELGIRLALGASLGATIRSVAAAGMGLAAIGAAVGLVLSIPATAVVSSFLTRVTERDPATYVSVAALMLIVAAVASLAPALRILRLNPVEALR
jgi:predicted permease